jgi:hypothetical protein
MITKVPKVTPKNSKTKLAEELQIWTQDLKSFVVEHQLPDKKNQSNIDYFK